MARAARVRVAHQQRHDDDEGTDVKSPDGGNREHDREDARGAHDHAQPFTDGGESTVALSRAQGWRGPKPPCRRGARAEHQRLHEEQRERAHTSRGTGERDPGELQDELSGGRHRDRARQIAARDSREQRVARRHDERGERPEGHPVREHDWIADDIREDRKGERERREQREEVIAHEKGAAIGAVRRRAAKEQEGDGRPHQRQLGEPETLR